MAIAGIGFTPNYRAQSVQRQRVNFQAGPNNLTGSKFVEALEASVKRGNTIQTTGDATEAIRRGIKATPCLSRVSDQVTESRAILAQSVTPSKKS